MTKNIIVLSDGTGNGAAKQHRTNIWRMYNALDLQRPDQIAFYGEGVGSQEFLPLKIIGGVFGYGLKDNVLELYKFLCRNYNHNGGVDPDKIFLFGFSRGAFTVRVLSGMITYCGLYTSYANEQDLDETAEKNYRAYRSRYKHGFLSLSRALRALTSAPTAAKTSVSPNIEFIGVWDTVDAYGFPIDELADVWDTFIFPIRFPDQRLSDRVIKACHAISLDDERHTFHPVLWDESHEERLVKENKVAKDRIEQVWFAGAHSDVGGGYPRDELALVTLDWMISKVEATLHFIPTIRDEYRYRSDWHGMQHDSRSGFAAYYRYKPRNVSSLCNDPENRVTINTPKIHRSVFERIKCHTVPYAPTGLPASYQVVSTRDSTPTYEKPPQSAARTAAMEYALDVIYLRRWLYRAFLVTSIVVVGSRFFLDWTVGGTCKGSACAIDPLLDAAINLFPDFTTGWFEAWRQNPQWLWGIIAAFGLFSILKSFAWRDTQLKATTAWSELKFGKAPPPWTMTLLSKLRLATKSRLRKAVKFMAIYSVVLLILFLFMVLVSRTTYHIRSSLGLLYADNAATTLENSQTLQFDIKEPCFATGIMLTKGKTYRFEVEKSIWKDGTQEKDPNGYTTPKLYWAAPLRRVISEPWLKLVGRIGNTGNEEFIIGPEPKEYKAKADGQLYFYVNDAVFGFFPGQYWAWPYFWKVGMNQGTATVTVTLMR